MCGSKGGDRASGPPGKSQVIWVSIEINTWTPPPPPPPGKSWTPLYPWKSIVFSVIKPLDLLCKLYNKLRTERKQKKKKKTLSRLFYGRRDWTPLTKIPGSAHGDYELYQKSPALSRCAFKDVYVFCVPKNLLFDLWI